MLSKDQQNTTQSNYVSTIRYEVMTEEKFWVPASPGFCELDALQPEYLRAFLALNLKF